MKRLWRIRGKNYDLSANGMVMGIVNVTPDSFSDGGRYLDTSRAVEHALKLATEGADILDIGGESTRPGAEPVDEAEEIRRVLPVIRAVRTQTKKLISIDTMKASVARAAIDAGADIINDVTGLRGDPAMIRFATECDAGLVIMHMIGTPQTMQHQPHYDDVVREVREYFIARLRCLEHEGIESERIALDPGFGFGKTLDHNVALLNALPELAVEDRPLLVGVSRKSMIGALVGSSILEDRDWPTVALTSQMREAGANIVRVHVVRPNLEALRMTEAILREPDRTGVADV